MTILPFIYGIAAGISLYSAAYHLFVGLRQRPHNRTYLIFSLLSAVIAGVILTDGAYRLITTLAEAITVLRIGITLTGVAMIALLWFVAEYTAVRPRIFLVVASMIWGSLALLNLFSPFSILYEEISDVATNSMPWGEPFITLVGTPSSLQTVNVAMFLATFAYIFYAIARQGRRGDRRPALLLALGLAPIIIGTIFDFLIDFGIVTNFVGLYPISFVGLVLIMSLVLADEVVKAGILQRELVETTNTLRTQTRELETYREQLEDLVEERTVELSRAVAELNTLNQIAQTVANFRDLPTTLQAVCETVAPLFDASVVVVNVISDSDRESVDLMAGYDRDTHDHVAVGIGRIMPLASTRMMQQVLHTREPFTATGLQASHRPISQILVERNIDALLIVPLISRGSIIGVLGVLRDQVDTQFDDADTVLAETIAGYVAGAIESAQLTQQLADTAVAEERSRIARELHDSVTQNLYTVATIADAIPDLWDTHPEETRRALDNLRRLSRGALAEMRILLLELRPTSLLEKPLGQLLQQLGESVEGRSRIQVTTTLAGDRVFADDVQVALYRIAQEALNNVIKHSEATQLMIGLYSEHDEVSLSVRDNGRGFDVDSAEYHGFGLENMHERARQIRAKLLIDSEHDAGTEVSVVWQDIDN